MLNWYGPVWKLCNRFLCRLKIPNFICIIGGEACRQMYCIGVVFTVVLQDFAYISIVKKFPVALWSIYSKQSIKFCTRKESMHYLCPAWVLRIYCCKIILKKYHKNEKLENMYEAFLCSDVSIKTLIVQCTNRHSVECYIKYFC